MRKIQTRFGEIIEEGPRHLLSDHSTEFMLASLEIKRDSIVAEAGCGTGVLCIYAALSGASKVFGTDIDDESLSAARRNAEINSVKNVFFIKGNLLAPLETKVDTVVAILPHKPAPRPFNHRYYGGKDGTDLLLSLIGESANKLSPDGRLYLYLNSIANPSRVLSVFRENFSVSSVAEKKRYFTREEFDGLTAGMFEYLCALRSEGKAEFHEDEHGLFFLANIYLGRLRNAKQCR